MDKELADKSMGATEKLSKTRSGIILSIVIIALLVTGGAGFLLYKQSNKPSLAARVKKTENPATASDSTKAETDSGSTAKIEANKAEDDAVAVDDSLTELDKDLDSLDADLTDIDSGINDQETNLDS